MLTWKQSAYYLRDALKQSRSTQQVFQIHAQIIAGGHHSSSSDLLTLILRSFASLLVSSPPSLAHRRVSASYAVAVFDLIDYPSAFCYNTLIRAHTLLSFSREAIDFFAAMRRRSVSPDTHTFPFALKACSLLRSVSLARTLHSQSLKFGFSGDVFVRNNLILAYSVNGRAIDAHQVFDESSARDIVTYNAMIDAFVKGGNTKMARKLFDEMPERDSVSWGTLMAGYSQTNQFKDTIELFDSMISSSIRPDNVAIVSALSACAHLGEFEKGKSIHQFIEKKKIRIDSFLSTSLTNFYSKCGFIDKAIKIFDSSPERNIFTWNSMLAGLAMNGLGHNLLEHFSKMVEEAKIQPDGITFLVLLMGCSHTGLIDEAKQLFSQMEEVYGVCRELKHYGSMADLLGRAGLIREAMDMIKAMPMGGDKFVWGGLLGGCRIHGNVEVAIKAAEQVMEISPNDGGVYSVLAGVYANSERWEDLTEIRRSRDCKRVKRIAGCSLIQLDGCMHEFVAGDDLHPQSDEIYSVLNGIGRQQFER